MIKKSNLYFFLAYLATILLQGCSGDREDTFALPDDVRMENYGHFDPLWVDYLLESPLKQPFFWRDSLIALCHLKKIEIVRVGNKKPDDIAERTEFLFDLSGKATSYYYYNFELSKDLYSEVKFIQKKDNISGLESPVSLGKKIKQSMKIQLSDSLELTVRKKNGNEGDTTFIYHVKGIPIVRIEKLGTFVSKVQFYLPSNKPLSELKSILKKTGISDEDFLLAEKSVTFMDNNHPQRSYYLTEDFIKGDLTEMWFYGNFNELSAYKKYINNTCVKDMKFNYSKDKLLRSFENNRLKYEVIYQ